MNTYLPLIVCRPCRKEGKYVVLFFYPLDFTFVCPTEITAFSDQYDDFSSLNCEVLGVSVDSKFSHLAWIQTERTDGGVGALLYPAGSAPDSTKAWRITHRKGTPLSVQSTVYIRRVATTCATQLQTAYFCSSLCLCRLRSAENLN